MTLYSHYSEESSKKLKDHLLNVASHSQKTVNNKKIYPKTISKESLEEISYILGISHDLGKATTFFQNYLVNGSDEGRRKNHALISSLLSYVMVEKICKERKINRIYSSIALEIVKRHHGDLSEIGDYDKNKSDFSGEKLSILKEQIENIETGGFWGETKSIYDELLEDIEFDFEECFFETKSIIYGLNKKEFLEEIEEIKEDFEECFSLEEKIGAFLIGNFLFSVLIETDKRDASNLEFFEPSQFDGEDFVEKFLSVKKTQESKDELNLLRESFFKEIKNNTLEKIDKNIFSITAPTGIGKTLTAYSSALKIKQKNDLDRIIYALPFTSIIDQNFSVIENVLKENIENFESNYSDYLVKHHYLAKDSIKTRGFSPENYFDEALFVESWQSRNIITTFVQLFQSILGNKNSFVKKFHNIANSVIIMDEVQNFPIKYWKIMENVFKIFTEIFDSKIILLTATQPKIFENTEELSNKNKYFNNKLMNRVDLTVDLKNRDLEGFAEFFRNEFDESKKRYLFVANTKKSALEAFQKLRNEKRFENYKKFLLTTNMFPKHRREKIEEISNSEKCIVVSTQLIEAGVDLDFGVVFRDLGPADSIVQVAGRCNREGKLDKGEMYLLRLVNEKSNPFSFQVYDNFLLQETENVFGKNSSWESKEFVRLTQEYFEQASKRAESNKEKLDYVKNLDYDEVGEFKIIENNLPTIDVFVVYDNNAKNMLNRFLDIRNSSNMDKYKKSGELKKIRKDMKDYVVSIPENLSLTLPLEDIDGLKGIRVLYGSEQGEPEGYSKELGIKEPDNFA